jgi:hypothetical protein
MGVEHLCLIFCINPLVCSQTISAMLSLVVQGFKMHPLGRVTFPNADKMKGLQANQST